MVKQILHCYTNTETTNWNGVVKHTSFIYYFKKHYFTVCIYKVSILTFLISGPVWHLWLLIKDHIPTLFLFQDILEHDSCTINLRKPSEKAFCLSTAGSLLLKASNLPCLFPPVENPPCLNIVKRKSILTWQGLSVYPQVFTSCRCFGRNTCSIQIEIGFANECLRL